MSKIGEVRHGVALHHYFRNAVWRSLVLKRTVLFTRDVFEYRVFKTKAKTTTFFPRGLSSRSRTVFEDPILAVYRQETDVSE